MLKRKPTRLSREPTSIPTATKLFPKNFTYVIETFQILKFDRKWEAKLICPEHKSELL